MLDKVKTILLASLMISMFACRQNPTDIEPESNRSFIDGLVPHHEMALMMADDAITSVIG